MTAIVVRAASCSRTLVLLGTMVCACLPAPALAQQPAARKPPIAMVAPATSQRFDTPQQAVDALVQAADKFDVAALLRIFGRDGEYLILTGEPPQDRQRAADFAVLAKQETRLTVDEKIGYAYLAVGHQAWPFPVPLTKRGSKWVFDSITGRQEVLNRRIGANELDAVTICRGYVTAQYEYAYKPRQGYAVHQYAQRVISTPGKQDGLAWQNPDGTWDGPVGEHVARAIAQGYTTQPQPYHGYYFKVLKGQGPAAPFGAMNFVVKGAMIGGFGLAAAPAEYRGTGVKTFIVSYEGIVYQKDLGPRTLQLFKNMTLYNPDNTWQRTDDNW